MWSQSFYAYRETHRPPSAPVGSHVGVHIAAEAIARQRNFRYFRHSTSNILWTSGYSETKPRLIESAIIDLYNIQLRMFRVWSFSYNRVWKTKVWSELLSATASLICRFGGNGRKNGPQWRQDGLGYISVAVKRLDTPTRLNTTRRHLGFLSSKVKVTLFTVHVFWSRNSL